MNQPIEIHDLENRTVFHASENFANALELKCGPGNSWRMTATLLFVNTLASGRNKNFKPMLYITGDNMMDVRNRFTVIKGGK